MSSGRCELRLWVLYSILLLRLLPFPAAACAKRRRRQWRRATTAGAANCPGWRNCR